MSTKKAILWVVFVSCPSILLAGYLVYKIKETLVTNGVSINENIYWLVLFLVMWLVMFLTSKKVLKEVFSNNNKEITPE